jgi:hypothetical protein
MNNSSSSSNISHSIQQDGASGSPDRRKVHTSLNHSLAGIASLPTSQTDDAANALLQLSIALLDSAIDILSDSITTDEQLTKESLLMPGGTLGKHFRHVRRFSSVVDRNLRLVSLGQRPT